MATKVTNFFKDGTENYKPSRVRIVGDRAIEESDVVVHIFNIGDTEDPDLIAGLQMMDWQNSEPGQWINKNCIGELYWMRMMDHLSYGYQYRIVARLTKQNETFFKLKFK
jgi:hypothetical protein